MNARNFTNRFFGLLTSGLLVVSCGDSSSVVTTVITTAGSDTSPTVPTSDTDDETTETSTSTGGIEPTTTNSSTTVDITTSTTDVGPGPGDPPEYCIENEDGETSAPVTCTATAETWCSEVEAFAAEYLPEPYLGIAVANCEASGRVDPCSVCFYISNTKCQVSGPCDDDIIYECGCLARAHGMI